MKKIALIGIALMLILGLVVACEREVPRGSPVYKGSLIAGSDDYVKLYSGSDLTGYSDAGSNATFTLDTATGDMSFGSDPTGGNAGAKPQISGIPKLAFVSSGGVMPNGTTETVSYMDDSPTGEYAPIDADCVEAEGSVDGIYRVGASSYKCAFTATAAATDGFKRTITTDNLEADESIGFWIYPSVDIASGDLQILLTDDGGARNFALPALSKQVWTWVEIDISSLTGGTGDVVTEFGITLTTQGATNLNVFSVYVDYAYKWDGANEKDLGVPALVDGVIAAICILDANTNVHTTVMKVEGTDWFVNYQSGNEVVVPITDLSTFSCTFVVAY